MSHRMHLGAAHAHQAAIDPSLSSSSHDPEDRLAGLRRTVEAGLIGRSGLVDSLLIALLSGGHLLLEGPPGLAKTRAVKLLSRGLEGSFARIQCTPDLMPSDLTGMQVFRPEEGRFEFVSGPIFHSLVLVDEINRAPPKVQSALLEAMGEAQVTAGGVTHPLPQPFMVVATQNSIEHEGTFPLPEAQLDRFMMHVLVDFPDEASELAILDLAPDGRMEPGAPPAETVSANAILAARQGAANVHLSPALKRYIVRLVMATRPEGVAADLKGKIGHAVSPRGSLALAAGARARAYLGGRDHAIPEDVEAIAADILAHRLVPTWRAAADGVTGRGLVETILARIEPL